MICGVYVVSSVEAAPASVDESARSALVITLDALARGSQATPFARQIWRVEAAKVSKPIRQMLLDGLAGTHVLLYADSVLLVSPGAVGTHPAAWPVLLVLTGPPQRRARTASLPSTLTLSQLRPAIGCSAATASMAYAGLCAAVPQDIGSWDDHIRFYAELRSDQARIAEFVGANSAEFAQIPPGAPGAIDYQTIDGQLARAVDICAAALAVNAAPPTRASVIVCQYHDNIRVVPQMTWNAARHAVSVRCYPGAVVVVSAYPRGDVLQARHVIADTDTAREMALYRRALADVVTHLAAPIPTQFDDRVSPGVVAADAPAVPERAAAVQSRRPRLRRGRVSE